MTQLSLFEASEQLRHQAHDLSRHKPMPIEIIRDLVGTSERLCWHTENLEGYRAELASILADLEALSREARPQQPGSIPDCPLEKWRYVAREFHGVQECLGKGQLQPDFEPADLARLRKNPGFTPATRGVFAFLLHIYNSSNRFDLAETQRWDEDHLAAFRRWVNGQSTGRPCHYF